MLKYLFDNAALHMKASGLANYETQSRNLRSNPRLKTTNVWEKQQIVKWLRIYLQHKCLFGADINRIECFRRKTKCIVYYLMLSWKYEIHLLFLSTNLISILFGMNDPDLNNVCGWWIWMSLVILRILASLVSILWNV